jgi:hypothetical protein
MKILNDVDFDNNQLLQTNWNIVTVSQEYSINPDTDEYVFCDASSAGFPVNLPSAIDYPRRILTIKKIDSTPNNPVTVIPVLNQTIDGELQQVLRNRNALKLISDGSNWQVV